jgi:hypothetical protein
MAQHDVHVRGPSVHRWGRIALQRLLSPLFSLCDVVLRAPFLVLRLCCAVLCPRYADHSLFVAGYWKCLPVLWMRHVPFPEPRLPEWVPRTLRWLCCKRYRLGPHLMERRAEG